MEKKTSVFTNGIIWFGVAISVSEIECGIEIGASNTPDGLWLPLILGHVLGGIMLYFVGLIGARVRLNAMETTASTFGKYGSKFFASLNLLQLIGWIAVLNAQGAMALAGLNLPVSFPLTCIILAVLIAAWVFVGLRRTQKITTVVMGLLAVLLVVLTAKFFGLGGAAATVASSGAASSLPTFNFWTVFEISIAMPLSWLPVISDYTKDVARPRAATAVSAIAYSAASFWMYFIGLQIAGLGVGTNIAQAILLAGIGIPGILIVALSTVTTNFLAANSAGESAKAIVGRLNPKVTGVVVCALSTVLAIWGIVDHYIHFLYLIASVFAPMAAVLLVSFFFVKEHLERKGFWIWNLFAWLVGFASYQVAVNTGFDAVGPTLLAVAISAALTFAAKIKK
ncbi:MULTISPECIES: cytosine permease [unclassified Fibrobacter]|uniref:cytosine permease n=1 Tax=unclassified Fibrobacter TaxID=2634177 RepID=UPI000911BEC3|nr:MULTISPECIES: cytosine permease [unclassified Fibrobacter]MDO4947630.1 cytosine permease [Fibrobacter sp.]OWV08150.1 cytosine permease [Fibrobacter sp. UWH3]SHK68822.1 putative hydroxymethylpyrimidine transporter CytX [Fibrobacter sp. UWH6]